MLQTTYKKWTTLIGGLIIHFSLGSYYTFGNFSPYLTSYLREITGSDVRYSTSNWILTSLSMSISVASVLVGFFCSKYRPKLVLVIFIGCMVMTSAVALTYFAIQHSFILTLLTYGILNGIGVGISYLTPLEIAMRWFPESKGLASSCILFGYGAGGIVFNQVITRYINPDNLSPDMPYSPQYPDEKYFSKAHTDLLKRVPQVYLIIAGICLALQIIGCLLMFENKINVDNKASINDEEENETTKLLVDKNVNSLGLNFKDSNEGFSAQQIIKMPIFYIILLMYLNSGHGATFVITYYKDFGQTFINNDDFLSIVGSLSSLFNASGRLFWGRLIDKISFKLCYLILMTIVISLVSTISALKFIMIKEIYLIWVCLINFTISGIYVIVPNAIVKCFGQKNFTSIYGLFILINFPITFGSTFFNLIIDSAGWSWYFTLGSCLSLIGFFSAFFFTVKKEDGSDI